MSYVNMGNETIRQATPAPSAASRSSSSTPDFSSSPLKAKKKTAGTAAIKKKAAGTTAIKKKTAGTTAIKRKTAGTTAIKKKPGRPAGFKAINTTKVANKAGDGEKKKKRRKLSSDAKARKIRLAARVKRESLGSKGTNGEADDEGDSDLEFPKNAPKPEKVYNDELGDEDLEYEAERLCGSKIDQKGNREYLVKWVGWDTSSNTWEPEVNLRNALDLITVFDQEYPKAP